MIPLGITTKKQKDFTYGQWTPTLSCLTPSEAPTVEYSVRKGNYVRIRIAENVSIVFIDLTLRGNITQINTTGNNYATIAGLPFTQIFYRISYI